MKSLKYQNVLQMVHIAFDGLRSQGSPSESCDVILVFRTILDKMLSVKYLYHTVHVGKLASKLKYMNSWDHEAERNTTLLYFQYSCKIDIHNWRSKHRSMLPAILPLPCILRRTMFPQIHGVPRLTRSVSQTTEQGISGNEGVFWKRN